MTLQAQRPAFTSDEARRLAEEHYGLTGTLHALPSERDQNFRLTTPGGESFVLKLSGAAEPADHLEFQNAALRWLADHNGEALAPRLCPTVTGEHMVLLENTRRVRTTCASSPGFPARRWLPLDHTGPASWPIWDGVSPPWWPRSRGSLTRVPGGPISCGISGGRRRSSPLTSTTWIRGSVSYSSRCCTSGRRSWPQIGRASW